MVRLHLAIFALLAACGSSSTAIESMPKAAPPEETPPTAKEWELVSDVPTRLFGNADGVRLELVAVRSPLDPSLKSRYLLRATGTQSEFDGLVIVVVRERYNKVLSFRGQLRGEPGWLLRHFTGSANWSFRGYDSTHADDEVLRPIDGTVDGETLLSLREEQRDSALREIEPQTREAKEKWQQRILDESMAEIPGDCGRFRFSVDWSTVPDEAFERTSISELFRAPVVITKNFCEQNPKQAKMVGDSLSIVCTYSEGHDKPGSRWSLKENSDGGMTYVPGGDTEGRFSGILQLLREKFDTKRKVLRLGDQHFIIEYKLDRAFVFYGRGNSYWAGQMSKDSDPRTFSLPSGAVVGQLGRTKEGVWELNCGGKVQALEELKKVERDAILKNATFEAEAKWKREPYFLSRDSHGTYYYVDRYQREFGGKRYRVFVGRRGQLKITKLKRLVEDSEGTLFSTEKGDLRLVVNSGDRSAVWIRGRKETPLTPVKVRANLRLIYDELGVYYGDELGFVCE